jgi:protein phosphatase
LEAQTVAVRVYCPHCITPSQVAEQYLGGPVQCYKCKQSFTPRPAAAGVVLPKSDPVAPAAGPCRLDIGAASSRGRVRERNEDSLFVQQLSWISSDQRHEIALIVVADGLGGYEGGDRASCLVIRTMGTVLAPLLNGALNGKFKDAAVPDLVQTIEYAIQEANRTVYRAAKKNPAHKDMGATVAAVLVWDGQALIGHVGDCRVYHQRSGQLTQVTRDQTLTARMVELGHLTPEEALTHEARTQVTQAVGKRANIEPARYDLKLARGDWLLVACDGLHTHVDDRTIQDAVTKAAFAAAPLADQLVDLANWRGGSDNCTVVVAYCY